MKVIAVVLVILIVGIFGSISGEETFQNQNRNLTKHSKVTHAIWKFFDDLTNKTSDYIPVANHADKTKCETNGGPKASDACVQAFPIHYSASHSLINATRLQLKIISNDQQANGESIVRTACHYILTRHNLVKDLTDACKPCWTTTERSTIDLLHNMISELAQYICQDGGSRFIAFLAADGVECLQSTSDETRICNDRSFSRNTSIIENRRSFASFNIPWDIPTIVLTAQACREFETFQRCTLNALRGCQYTTPSYEINSLLNIMKISSGCGYFLEA